MSEPSLLSISYGMSFSLNVPLTHFWNVSFIHHFFILHMPNTYSACYIQVLTHVILEISPIKVFNNFSDEETEAEFNSLDSHTYWTLAQRFTSRLRALCGTSCYLPIPVLLTRCRSYSLPTVHFAFKTSSLLRNSKEKKKSKTNKRNTFVLNILSCSHLRPSKIINTYLSPFHLQNSHNLQISFIIWFQPPYCHFPLSSLCVSLTRLYALPVFSTFSCAVSCFLNVFFFISCHMFKTTSSLSSTFKALHQRNLS